MIDQRHTNKIFCGSVLHYLILPRRQCQGFSGCEKTTPAGASWIREKYKPFISIPNILPNHQFCHVPVKGIRLDVQGSSAFHRHAPFFTGASVCLLRPWHACAWKPKAYHGRASLPVPLRVSCDRRFRRRRCSKTNFPPASIWHPFTSKTILCMNR